MPSQTVILNAAGLITSPNELSRTEGALIEASNVIVKRDGIIEQRRGFSLYGTPLPSSNQRVKQLTTYRNRILRHYGDTLAFDSNGLGAFLDFAGSVSETEAGLRMKFIESNGNLYFTTSAGIKKISARSANDFTTTSGFINSAGAIKAVDLDAEAIYTAQLQSGFLPQDSVVAYRVLWAYKDLNNNLIPGAPSQRAIASNSMLELVVRDFVRTLSTLDGLANTPLTSARIADYNYVQTLGLTLNSSAFDLYTNLIALSAKLDNDIFLADQAAVAPLQITTAVITAGICTITFSSGNPSLYMSAGSNIFLSGFTPAVGTINGAQTVTTVNATTLTFNTTATGIVALASAQIRYNEFRSITEPTSPSIPATNAELVELQDYLSAIFTVMSSTPAAIISVADKVTTDALDVTTSSNVSIRITIPDGINSNYFFQVYRSSVQQATGAGTFDDLVPSDELQLVYEAFPTVAELAAQQVTFTDITPDSFRGANLYTNASTGEGILQANEPPPFAKDINRYRNSVFYANTRTNQNLLLSLLGVTQMIADYDNSITPKITTSNGDTTNTYSFIVGQQEITTVATVADVANSLNSKYFLINSVSKAYYVYFETTTAIDPAIPDRTGIKVKIATGETANNVAQKLRDTLSTYLDDFTATVLTNVVTVVNVDVGEAPDAADGNTTFVITNTQQGRGERVQPQITEVQAITGSSFKSSGTADYFTFNTTLDRNQYYIWFNRGTVTDPSISGRVGLEVAITGAETAVQVADLIAAAIPASEFTTLVVSSKVTVTNIQYGTTSAATETVLNAGFTVTTTQSGALDVLLSPLASPARAVDETARSLVRIINKNPGDSIYAYYVSGAFDVPGKMFLQARSLENESAFYVLGNNANTGISFNPDISPTGTVTSITAASPSVVTTSVAHGLMTGDQVMLSSTNSVGPVDGLFTVAVISPTTFSVPVSVTTPGTSGSFIKATDALYSENEERANRVYYSKFQQPEAVPIVNYFDVGAQDKAVLRVFPMRDSLFIFKEDGLYRISGEAAPFQLELFDSSFITLAPDSVTIANNIVYAWTTQGIQSLTEGGSAVISRPIDNTILKIQSSNYANFKTATWARGYESDNSYIVYTVSQETDTFATIAYRYSTLTESWTTFDTSHACGIINSTDDKLYLGATDVAYIEKERKTFSRLDYADREYSSVVSNNAIIGKNLILPVVSQFNIGDVLVQDQTITTYEFNMLLDKLDMDSGVADNNYNTLAISAGANPRTALLALAAKLDSDAGVNNTTFASTIANKNGTVTSNSEVSATVITSAGHGLFTGRVVLIDSSNSTPSINGTYAVTVLDANRFSILVNVTVGGTAGNWQTVNGNFEDLKTCYNKVIDILNTDTGVAFNNYSDIDNNTIQETIITGINRATKTLTLNYALDYLIGDVTVFKAITSTFTYSPNTMGDPLNHKHLREATIMFDTRTLTGAILSFMTDLLPEFQDVPFTLDGNGIFGHSSGFGVGFFGGLSNSAPFRTYIPRQCQRCRYVIVKYTHNIAREDYRITGTTVTGEIGISSRAFR